MSWSTGTGSPIVFMCPTERRQRNRAWSSRARSYAYPVWTHPVELTGRTRPYRPSRGSALGLRSRTTSREYRCQTCGHVGWSNHGDLERLAVGYALAEAIAKGEL